MPKPTKVTITPQQLAAVRYDIAGFARLLGLDPHPGQERIWEQMVMRDQTGFRAYWLTIAISAGNRAGKTLMLAVYVLHSVLFKMGMRQPDAFDDVELERFSRLPYDWYHFGIQQEIGELLYHAIVQLLTGTHEAQRKHGCPLVDSFGPIATYDAKERGEYRWIRMDPVLGGGEIHFRTTAERGVGSLGKDMYGISFDECGFERNLAFIVNEVLHNRRMSTGGQLVLISTPSEGFCVEADTPVLTDDLRWVPAGSLSPGDGLWAFDEKRRPGAAQGARAWQAATVTTNFVTDAPTMRIRMASGREVISTPNHRWLVKDTRSAGTAWRRTDAIMPGDMLVRYLPVWGEQPDSWLAGMLDGEGYVSHTPSGPRLGIAQNPGPVLERIKAELSARGIGFTENAKKGAATDLFITGGVAEVMRTIGVTRPTRLLPKMRLPKTLKRMKGDGLDAVVAVEDAGVRPIANLQTSSKTYFAAGYGAHNTDFADEWKKGDPENPLREPDHISFRMSTRDNIGYGIDQDVFDRLVRGIPDHLVPQNIDGHFIQGRKAFFDARAVDRMFVRDLPEERPRERAHRYVQGVDPAATYDATWSIVLDATVDGRAEGVKATKRAGRQKVVDVAAMVVNTHRAYTGEGAVCETAVDVTGMGGKVFKEMLGDLHPFRGVEFGGTKKTKMRMLTDLKGLIEQGRLRFPRSGVWLDLRKQLLAYVLEDRQIEQDAVMALAVGVKQVMRQMANAVEAAPFDFFEPPKDDDGNVIPIHGKVPVIDMKKHRLARRLSGVRW